MTVESANVEPVEYPLVIVCSGCQRVIYTPDDFTPATPVARGICSDCERKQRERRDA